MEDWEWDWKAIAKNVSLQFLMNQKERIAEHPKVEELVEEGITIAIDGSADEYSYELMSAINTPVKRIEYIYDEDGNRCVLIVDCPYL